MNTQLIRIALVAILTVSLPSTVPAQDSLSRRDLEIRLDTALYDVTAAAAKLFNAGNEDGSCKLFEGALRTAVPLLDHRPELKKRVEGKLQKAKALPDAGDRAFALREVVDDIRSTFRKAPAVVVVPPPVPAKTLWDRLGGEKGLRPIIKEFVTTVTKDPKVNEDRGGRFKREPAVIETGILEFISSVTGGPLAYLGRDMKSAHAGMGISEAEFEATGGHFLAALKKFNVPQKETSELMTILASFKKQIVEDRPKTLPPAPPVTPTAKSLWERLGGEDAVKKVVHDFVAAAAKNPKVNFTRGGKYKLDDAGVAKLEKTLVDFISANSGGPRKYTGKDMKAAHAGMQITYEEFDALAADLIATLKANKVAQKEINEVVALVGKMREDIVEKK